MSALGQKQTFRSAIGMSALGHKRTSAAPTNAFDHLLYVLLLALILGAFFFPFLR
jgi:hypothetical protein